MDRTAFTLVELLVVVSIIAILAVAAVFSFSEASVRSKVARVRTDLRTISGAIEAYATDHGTYPPFNDLGTTPTQLSTPVAYLQRSAIRDPFYQPFMSFEQSGYYRYNNYTETVPADGPSALFEKEYYGLWLTYSNPPYQGAPRTIVSVMPPVSVLTEYDPTNGTTSPGRIIRSQRRS